MMARQPHMLTLLGVLIALILAGCVDDGPSSDITAASFPAWSPEMTRGDGASLTGRVLTVHGSAYEPASDVLICRFDEPEEACVVSDDDGVFHLKGLPEDADVTLSLIENDHHVPQLVSYHTASNAEAFQIELVTKRMRDELELWTDATFDEERGHVIVSAFSARGPEARPLPGVSGRLAPDLGEGPWYGNGYRGGFFAVTPYQQDTSPASEFGYVNLPRGTYEVDLEHEYGNCRPWWASGDERARVRVEPGYITWASVVCE